MLSLHTDSQPTQSASEMDTDELLRRLGRFPSPVLPVGVMRELQSRGDAIHDPLAALVDEAVDSLGNGLGSGPHSTFFAFALLVPIATKDDLARIEAVLTLPEKSAAVLIGDLSGEAIPTMVSKLFEDQSASELIDWIDGLADHPNLHELDAAPLYHGMTLAVENGHLDRNTAIDGLVSRLKRRADHRYDTQSAQIVYELMDLSASDMKAADAAVRSSYERGQIDTEYVEIRNWDDIDSHGRIRSDEKSWNDPAAELSRWCYEFVSDDLDPVDASFRVNPRSGRASHLQKSSVPDLVDQIRQSTDEHFPRDVVESVNVGFADAYHSTIAMIRAEVARYQVERDSWSGTGAYLGLVLTIANDMPLPTDLLQTILRLPESDREQIFGDQFGLIVQATALTPLRQHDFIEQWIWDTDRSNADRREMVLYFLKACHSGLLDREVAVERLAGGMRRALQDEPMLIGPYAECLAFFTTREHQQVLDEAFARDDVEFFLPLEKMRRMAQDAEFAKAEIREYSRSYRSLRQMISNGVMFPGDVFEDKPRITIPREPVHQPTPQAQTQTKTAVRSEDRTPRNAVCPCGSGKKYKKCCLRK